jgi:hypothetical protein
MSFLSLIPIVSTVLDKILPDPKAAADAKFRMLEMVQKGESEALEADIKLAMGQMEVNKAEAASGNAFASSWRPLIGYIAGISLAYNFLVYPLLLWGQAIWLPHIMPPVLASDQLFELVLGMLGLAGFRTYEKVKRLNS